MALDGTRRLLGESHPDVATVEGNLGRMYSRQKRYAEAEPLLLAAYRTNQKAFGDEGTWTQRNARLLTDLYSAWGRMGQAAEWRAKLPKQPAEEPAGR